MIIDAHHHFWDPSLADYPWMTDEVAAIRRRFEPHDLEPLLREYGIDGTVVVQARGSVDETRWLLQIAEATPFVLGVVGWIDLTNADVASVLADLTGGRLVPERLHRLQHRRAPNRARHLATAVDVSCSERVGKGEQVSVNLLAAVRAAVGVAAALQVVRCHAELLRERA
jgi:predicted TIM-barrel fold metal-dependent hydrolase